MSEIRVNTIVAAEGISAPTLPYGVQLPTGIAVTGAGGLNITGIITAASFDGTINTGAAATFGGITKVSSTTDSTSTSTGALVVSGGAGIGGNVYIGAGLSVAGTVTYEDVTSVDSVGLITAKSGINITGGSFTQTGGGEFKVGSALTVGSVGVATFIGAAGVAVTITPSTGKVEATTGAFGPITATTISGTQLTGTLQTAAQTNVTSVGTLAGLTVGSAGELKVGTAVTISSTAGVSTFSQDVFFYGADDAKYVQWDASATKLLLKDNTYLGLGNAGNGDLQLYHDGTDSIINNATGDLKIYVKDGEEAIVCKDDEGVEIYYNDVKKFETTNDGVSVTGIATFSDGLHSNGLLRERANVVANKLSAGTNVEMVYGNVHYYSTNETTTATPNIRYNASYSLNSKMTIGEAVTVTIIYKPNNAGYYAQVTVDGNAVTEEWNGGSAPSSANSGGYDVLTHTLVKTADATFLCLSNVQNYA